MHFWFGDEDQTKEEENRSKTENDEEPRIDLNFSDCLQGPSFYSFNLSINSDNEVKSWNLSNLWNKEPVAKL